MLVKDLMTKSLLGKFLSLKCPVNEKFIGEMTVEEIQALKCLIVEKSLGKKAMGEMYFKEVSAFKASCR